MSVSNSVSNDKKRYLIESGWPSWHQQRAGHYFAGSLVLELTDTEVVDIRNKYKESTGRCLCTPVEKLPTDHFAHRSVKPAADVTDVHMTAVDIQTKATSNTDRYRAGYL